MGLPSRDINDQGNSERKNKRLDTGLVQYENFPYIKNEQKLAQVMIHHRASFMLVQSTFCRPAKEVALELLVRVSLDQPNHWNLVHSTR